MSFHVRGVTNSLAQLRRAVAKYKNKSRKGLIKAALLIKRNSMSRAYSPRDLGNLAGSHFVVWSGGIDSPTPTFVTDLKHAGTNLISKLNTSHGIAVAEEDASVGSNPFQVVIGVSAFYALFVHEADESVEFRVGQRKFLQRAISENLPNILAVIAAEARVTGSDLA